ncbi:MAG: histidine kinase [Bacteroidota bacterium]
MIEIIRDKRFWAYYAFTATVVAAMLLVEDLFEDEGEFGDILLEFISDIPVFTLLVSLISLITYPIIGFLNKRYPWEEALLKRFMLEMCIIIGIVLAMTIIGSYFVRGFELTEKDVDDDFGFEILALIMFFISTFMVFSFHEFMNLSTDKQFLEFKASRLEKQNYLIKYEALKSQINPHFLFNSLNVLSSLIYLDTTKSDEFIKRFSEVFRYVLELNQEKLVSVQRELKFLDSYFFLQKIRYGENLKLVNKLSDHVKNMHIPPLTLQLVVENAIKHNMITQNNQLAIILEDNGEYLYVKNNFQQRANLEESTGIGQKNLTEKYQLLDKELPKFQKEGDQYVVQLPLMKTKEWQTY